VSNEDGSGLSAADLLCPDSRVNAEID
jgi:hypothetical protein